MIATLFQTENRGAVFNTDRTHRYQLMRVWDIAREAWLFIMLNPSTADDKTDDRTIQSCMRLAKQNGAGGFIVVNLFSLITPYPDYLKENIQTAVDPLTDYYIKEALTVSNKIIYAWGNWNFISARISMVKDIVLQQPDKIPLCIGQNKNGSPRHPLYVSQHEYLKIFINKNG